MIEKALTYDDDKAPLAWLPWGALRLVSRVQQYGHRKYKDFSNYRKGMEVTRNLSCAMRHITEYLDGLDLDQESGEHHLAHAATRVLFVLQNIADGKAIDDRFRHQKVNVVALAGGDHDFPLFPGDEAATCR